MTNTSLASGVERIMRNTSSQSSQSSQSYTVTMDKLRVKKHSLPNKPTFREWGNSTNLRPGVIVWLEGYESPFVIGDLDDLGSSCGMRSHEDDRVVAHAVVEFRQLEFFE